MKVSLYCGTMPKSRTEPSSGCTEIEFSPAYSGNGAEYHVYYKADGDSERKLLSSRPMEEREIRQVSAALLALLARR